ncbi:MAG: flagellar L-ring protein [Gemmatimonadota bacterium]|nr:MAG: flagellar L-ring protein [Gemmatimonadota bacterium]
MFPPRIGARLRLTALIGWTGLLAGGGFRAAEAGTIVPTSGSLFSDHSAFQVGDIVTVLIVESSTATKSTLTRTNVEAEHSMSSLDKLDFLGMWDMDTDNRSVGEGSTARRGELQARITVEIMEVTPAGLLRVEGTRSVLVNGEEEIITLRGSLRAQDIQADNTVLSAYLSNAAIEYSGKGVLANAERPGYLTRIFNWLF